MFSTVIRRSVTTSISRQLFPTRNMAILAEGVEFDSIAREWRCKWSADNDKASLVEAQKVLAATLDTIKAIDGVKEVQRIVCGGCLDFKVITSLSVETFAAWQEADFAPEKEFLAKLESIDGITLVETQTFTLMKL